MNLLCRNCNSDLRCSEAGKKEKKRKEIVKLKLPWKHLTRFLKLILLQLKGWRTHLEITAVMFPAFMITVKKTEELAWN